MASIFDDLFSIFRDNKDIAMAGAGIYDFFQDRKQGGELKNFEQNIPQVDPFGSSNRSIYQNELAKLYQDPSYIAELPGYKFARSQGEKSIDRAAAKRGQFYSGNTLYQLSNFNQDLAGQFYDEEAKRLMQLSGANFPPNAGEAANLFRTGQQLQGNAPGSVLAGLDKAGAQGTLDGLMNILSGGKTAADVATGEGVTGGLMESLKSFFGGGDSAASAGVSAAGALSTSTLAPFGASGPMVPAYLTGGAGFPAVGPTLSGYAGMAGPAGGTAGTAAASGAGAAPGGLLSGGAGTALGAALPLALVAFGMSRSGKRKAKEAAAMKPYLDMVRNSPEGMFNIPGQGEVLGRMFNDPTSGSQYIFQGDPNKGTQRSMGVTDLATGTSGVWSPNSTGVTMRDGVIGAWGGHFSSNDALMALANRDPASNRYDGA